MRTFIALLATVSLAAPFNNALAQSGSPEILLLHQPCNLNTSVKVFVSEPGEVFLNGKAVAVESLSSAIDKLRPAIKTVCYSSANPQAPEPAPIALKFMDSITKLQLPIAFYWDSSFQQRVHFKQ